MKKIRAMKVYNRKMRYYKNKIEIFKFSCPVRKREMNRLKKKLKH